MDPIERAREEMGLLPTEEAIKSKCVPHIEPPTGGIALPFILRPIFFCLFLAYLHGVVLAGALLVIDPPGQGYDGALGVMASVILAYPWLKLVMGLGGSLWLCWGAILFTLLILGLLSGPWLYKRRQT